MNQGFKTLVARAALKASIWSTSSGRRQSRWTSSCPICWAGRVLSQLKQDPATRHIPVQIVTLDEDRQDGLSRGAFAFVTKPTTNEALQAALSRIKDYATRRRKRLLVVEDNAAEQLSITELLAHDDIDILIAGTGAEAIDALTRPAV